MTSSIHSDIKNTVRISARRYDQSPFYDCYANEETVLGVVAERFYGVFNGEDAVETYWNLRRKVVLYDVPEKPWQIEGPDAMAFMEKIFARNISTLKEGRGLYAIACAHDGGTFMDGILFRMAEDVFWYVQPDGHLLPWVMALSEGFDVKISDPLGRVLQIQGPNSLKVMSALTDGVIDESLKYFQSGYYDIKGQRLYVSRTGWTGELGYEIYSVGTDTSIDTKTDHHKLFYDVMEAGKEHGIVYGSMASMEIRRIEAGILDNLTDFDHTMTPFAAGLGPFIHTDKEGYVGRAALQGADTRVRLLGLVCKTAVPGYRGEVSEDGTRVGHVTASTWSPTLDCGVAYVRFDEPSDWIGKTLTVVTEDGTTADCEVVTLPFYDKEKKIPRGLDKTIP
ncbi:aminomethyl transferase family protein [Rhodobacterales bacterium LSUCC0387]|nr:aminomethyl transferase family protein [Rhodobacterales bacterium LSUCC0387]